MCKWPKVWQVAWHLPNVFGGEAGYSFFTTTTVVSIDADRKKNPRWDQRGSESIALFCRLRILFFSLD